MCRADDGVPTPKKPCCESVGDSIDEGISNFFLRIGLWIGRRPITTIVSAIVLAMLCAGGMAMLETENRGEELWVPQGTAAEKESDLYLSYYPKNARFNNIIVQSTNVLTKERLAAALELHNRIQDGKSSEVEGVSYKLTDLCTKAGGSCFAFTTTNPICQCLVTSILRQWNYNLTLLQDDTNVLETVNNYGSKEDLQAVLGNSAFDDNGKVLSAEAFTIAYYLEDRSIDKDGSITDPINEAWEKDVFLETVQSYDDDAGIQIDYFASRSFNDEFGAEIEGDIALVQISYIVVFIFLGATLGTSIKCGPGSRWGMSFAALALVVISTLAGFGVSSLFGLFYGPVHSILPFVLLGIGVDDAFVIANAFNRERTVQRKEESNGDLTKRCGRALARAGASISVTSATDFVAFAISSSSALPALASFCAYAAICIFFLWFFSATFFTACLVQDEKRQRDNRRDVLCCLKRKNELEEKEGYEEGSIQKYFRNYHAPAILSKPGKVAVIILFSGLIGFGIYGTMFLSAEDSSRNFLPEGSYLNDYFEVADEYFPSKGTDLYITFENGEEIYRNREALSSLAEDRLTGLSNKPPYIAEPTSDETYRNVIAGFKQYLMNPFSFAVHNLTLNEDGWPLSYQAFETSLLQYASYGGPGAQYTQDISSTTAADGTKTLRAVRILLEYVRLTKMKGNDEIDDAGRQIDAMDATRAMVDSWTDVQPAFPYCNRFLDIEGFKIIQRELFVNVGLALTVVGVIVLVTVANFVTAFLITACVAFCVIEILGFMYAFGIVIDNVSVINLVLAVGLSVDYSAHVGHCFMVKSGNSKDERVTEALADIGSSVFNGAASTFLAVIVLFGSSSYVFKTLSTQFALTVILGILHGLVLLPVLLSLLGPKPFASADQIKATEWGNDSSQGCDQDSTPREK